MIYYRQVATGKVFAYPEGVNRDFVRADLVLMTDAEVEAHLAPLPEPVPQAVSRFQARAALMQAGLLDAAESAVSGGSSLVKLAWADAQEFRRYSPTVQALGGSLGLTDDDLDALFVAASQIEA